MACELCLTKLPEDSLVKLQSCTHLFCSPCLAFLVETSLDDKIECPKFAKCHTHLLNSDIKKFVSGEVYENYLSRSNGKSSEPNEGEIFNCFGSDCSGIFEVNPSDNVSNYFCPKCSKLNCLSCKEIHDVPCVNGGNSPSRRLSSVNEFFEKVKIRAKSLKPETEEERNMRIMWENSWDDLRKRYESTTINGGINPATLEGLSLNAGSLINTQNRFECQICLMEIDSGDGVFLQECLHRFCRECLTGHIQHSEEAEIKCPFRLGNFSCPMTILEREVKSLISDEEHDKILKKSLMAAEMGAGNSVHCQSPNCVGWVIVESENIKNFVCFVCDKRNCIPCKAIHGSLTCEEYRGSLANDKRSADALEELLESRSASRCPKCNVVIIKNGGCDHMHCVACNSHFSWSTGTLWPTHNPDGTPIDVNFHGLRMMIQQLQLLVERRLEIGGIFAQEIAPQTGPPPPPPTATATAPPLQNITQNPPPQNIPQITPPQNIPQNIIQNAPPPLNRARNYFRLHPQNTPQNAPPPQNITQNPPPQNIPQITPPQNIPQNIIQNAPPPLNRARNYFRVLPQNTPQNAPPPPPPPLNRNSNYLEFIEDPRSITLANNAQNSTVSRAPNSPTSARTGIHVTNVALNIPPHSTRVAKVATNAKNVVKPGVNGVATGRVTRSATFNGNGVTTRSVTRARALNYAKNIDKPNGKSN